jgi:hypothetical protein
MRLVRRFFARGVRATLTILSWSVGVTAVATSGCSTSLPVAKARAGVLAEEYADDREAILLLGGRRYRLGPDQDLRLELVLWDWEEPYSAPLERFRKKGDFLVLPDGRAVHHTALEEVRLVVDDDQLVQIEKPGDLPARKRLFVGGQLGGTSLLQPVLRFRVVGPLSVEAGFMLISGSAGLVYEVPVMGNVSIYAGVGAGAFLLPRRVIEYGHARLGVGFRARTQNLWFGVDGGAWLGAWGKSADGPDDWRVAWPIPGFTILHEL